MYGKENDQTHGSDVYFWNKVLDPANSVCVCVWISATMRPVGSETGMRVFVGCFMYVHRSTRSHHLA